MLIAESIRTILTLVAVMSMIGIGAIVVKRLGLAPAAGGHSKQRRLAIVETLTLDTRRRAAIIRCDDVEHLIILGPNSETLIARDLAPPANETGNEFAFDNPFKTLREAADKLKGAASDAT